MKILPNRRILKRWAIGLGVVIGLLLIANGVMAWRLNSRLARQKAAVRAAGDPASIDELKPAPISDDENAAAQIEALSESLKRFDKAQVDFDKTAIGAEYDARRNEGLLPTKEQADAIRDIVKSFPELVDGARRIAACPQYASQNDFSLPFDKFIERSLDIAQRTRAFSRFQRWRMLTQIDAGEPDAAIDFGLQTLRLSRQFEAEPLLVSYLVALAIRESAIDSLYDAVSDPDVSESVLIELDEQLASFEDPKTLERVFKLERAASFEALNAHQSLTGGPPSVWARMLGWSVTCHYLGAYDLYAAILPMLTGEFRDVHRRLSNAKLLKAPTGYGVMADLLIPAVDAALDAHGRLLARIRCLRCYIGIRLFARESNREAVSLQEIDLPDSVKTDPFSGQPLIAKRTDDGWLIYSVMKNGVDDGGNFKDQRDYGVCPPGDCRAN